jgi:hypothetical protein
MNYVYVSRDKKNGTRENMGKERWRRWPRIGASGRDTSFRHFGTKTVISSCPRARNQSTAKQIPRQENTSLLPWLQMT